MQATEIRIRPFDGLEEMHACVSLHQAIWWYSDLDVVPHNILVVAHKTGGQVLGAFLGKRALGFVLAFPALRNGRPVPVEIRPDRQIRFPAGGKHTARSSLEISAAFQGLICRHWLQIGSRTRDLLVGAL